MRSRTDFSLFYQAATPSRVLRDGAGTSHFKMRHFPIRSTALEYFRINYLFLVQRISEKGTGQSKKNVTLNVV